MTQRIIWIAMATYGPEDDVEPLVAAGTTKEKAEFGLYEAIKEACSDTNALELELAEATEQEPYVDSAENWIEQEAFQIPLYGEQVQ